MAYNPAIDGIRGLAVGAVLLFHGGFPWARGGYLGVSTFFTLSGFLITSLLLGEQARSGRIGLTAFWARRLRRLLPASAATLGALLVSLYLVDGLWGGELPGDVVASALQVANWHFLWEDRSYGELFSAPSPALHFWSLAIEEQFYWVFPVVSVVVLRLGRGSLRVYAGVLGALLAGSAVLTFVLRDSPDAVYYATPVRMGEILVGALLAVALASGPLRTLAMPVVSPAAAEGNGASGAPSAGLDSTGGRLAPSEGLPSAPSAGVVWGRRVAGVLGALALAASGWAWWNVEQSSTVLSQGGLLVYAGASGLLVLAACVPGPVRRLLSFEPLRLLGLVSYAVYLFHWPLFLVLTPERVDDLVGRRPGGWALFAVRVAPTLALAAVSYVVLEQPIRRGRRPRRVMAPLLAVGSVAAVVVAALVVPDSVLKADDDQFQTTEDILAEADRKLDERREAMPDTALDVMFFGDSAALTVAAGVGEWGLRNEELLLVGDGATTQVGCGIGRGGERRQFGAVSAVPETCPSWDTDWAPEIESRDGVQVAVLLTGSWDVMDRKLPGDDQWRGLGDPVYDDYMRAEIAGATEVLLAEGLNVVWLTTPPLEFGRAQVPKPPPDPPDTLERITRLNQLISEVVATHQGAAVVDFGGHFAALSQAENDRLRPDGVHVDLANSLEVAQWVAPEILAAVDRAGAPEPASEPVSGN